MVDRIFIKFFFRILSLIIFISVPAWGQPLTGLEDDNILRDIVPYQDIVVISKKFLPKSDRLEAQIFSSNVLNNAFFSNLGLGLGLSYYFTEKYAVDFNYIAMFEKEKDITKGLREGLAAETNPGVIPKGYVGLGLRWNPIYGKMSFFNLTLIPFDFYFGLGLGLSHIEIYSKMNSVGKEQKTFEKRVLSLSFNTGQQFALTRNFSFDWKILWNFYTVPKGGTVSGLRNDIIFSVGTSWYFPGRYEL